MREKVVFYFDRQLNASVQPNEKSLHKICKHLNADEPLLKYANLTYGFNSGINWKELENQGAIAVVLVNVEDGCAIGAAQEIQRHTNLKTYRLVEENCLVSIQLIYAVGQAKMITFSEKLQ